jgi:phosphatidylglycerophosphate synthase
VGVGGNEGGRIAFVIGVFSAIAICLEWLWPAVALLWLSGLFDAVDGTIARKTGTMSVLGAFLDIVFDRVVEILMLMALIFIAPELASSVAAVLSCIIISMTIFLTVGAAAKNTAGAAAKNTAKKSFYYQAGIAERTEGIIMISLAVLLENHRIIVLLAFAAIILFTASQRFIEAIKILKGSNG